MSRSKHQQPCPSCGSVDVAQIVWGLPDEELFASAERGEVALGGCIVTDADPNRECRQCGVRWAT